MLAHSFDRFYMDTKFMLPTIGDLKFSKLDLTLLMDTQEKNMPQTPNQGNIH